MAAITVRVRPDLTAAVTRYGALGVLGHDDSAAFQAAADYLELRGGGDLIVDRVGNSIFPIKGITIPRNVRVLSQHGAVVTNYDTTTNDATNSLLTFEADNGRLENIEFLGQVYDPDLHESQTITPRNFVQVLHPSGDAIANFEMENIRATGGYRLASLTKCARSSVRKIYGEDQFFEGILWTIPPTDGVTIDDVELRRVGIEEALQIGSTVSEASFAQYVIANKFRLIDCGKLHSNSALWQEAFDLRIEAFRKAIFSDFLISGCGNGGFELKSGDVSGDDTDVVEDIHFINGNIEITESKGTAINLLRSVTTPKAPDSAKARRIYVRGVNMRYAGPAAPTLAIAMAVQDYCHVHVTGGHISGEWAKAVHILPVSTTEAAAHHLSFGGGLRIDDGVQQGIVVGNGSTTTAVEDLSLGEAHIETTGPALLINGAATVTGLRTGGATVLKQTDSSLSSKGALQIEANAVVTGIEVIGSQIEGYDYSIRTEASGATASGVVQGARLKSNSTTGSDSVSDNASGTLTVA